MNIKHTIVNQKKVKGPDFSNMNADKWLFKERLVETVTPSQTQEKLMT